MLKLKNIDCIVGMEEMQGETVDLIIADPPYVISRESNFHTMKDRANPRTGTMLGNWDVEFDNKKWINCASRILKKGGSLIVFNDFRKSTKIFGASSDVGLLYKDTLIWLKTNPMPRNTARRYAPNVEMIQWYVKQGAKWTFNKQKENYESCVLPFAVESGARHKRYHPTQKSKKLIEYLITVHSNPGDTVLDPFLGGGTTAVSCASTGRKCIGFEIDVNYYNSCLERTGNDSIPT